MSIRPSPQTEGPYFEPLPIIINGETPFVVCGFYEAKTKRENITILLHFINSNRNLGEQYKHISEIKNFILGVNFCNFTDFYF